MFAKWGFITFVFASNVYNQKALFMNLIYSMSTLAWISLDSSSSGFLLFSALFPLGTVCLLKFRFADFLRRYRALPFVAIFYIIYSSLKVFKAALFDLLSRSFGSISITSSKSTLVVWFLLNFSSSIISMRLSGSMAYSILKRYCRSGSFGGI